MCTPMTDRSRLLRRKPARRSCSKISDTELRAAEVSARPVIAYDPAPARALHGRVVLGSTSTHLIREAACPVLVLPRGATAPCDAPATATGTVRHVG